jgi:WD40 repeat protein
VIAVAHDGSWIAGGVWRDPLQIIDTTSGHLIRRLPGLDKSVTAVAVSERNLLVISDRTLRVWDTTTWEETVHIKGPSGPVAVTEDGTSSICIITETRTLAIRSLASGALIDDMDVASTPLALAQHRSGIWLGCEDGTVQRYEYRP